MANSKANIFNVDFTAPIVVDRKKTVIQERGFLKKNSPIYNSCLSPLYKRESDCESYKNVTYQKDGTKWEVNAGILYKNDEVFLENFIPFYIEKEQKKSKGLNCITLPYRDRNDNNIKFFYIVTVETIFFDENQRVIANVQNSSIVDWCLVDGTTDRFAFLLSFDNVYKYAIYYATEKELHILKDNNNIDITIAKDNKLDIIKSYYVEVQVDNATFYCIVVNGFQCGVQKPQKYTTQFLQVSLFGSKTYAEPFDTDYIYIGNNKWVKTTECNTTSTQNIFAGSGTITLQLNQQQARILPSVSVSNLVNRTFARNTKYNTGVTLGDCYYRYMTCETYDGGYRNIMATTEEIYNNCGFVLTDDDDKLMFNLMGAKVDAGNDLYLLYNNNLINNISIYSNIFEEWGVITKAFAFDNLNFFYFSPQGLVHLKNSATPLDIDLFLVNDNMLILNNCGYYIDLKTMRNGFFSTDYNNRLLLCNDEKCDTKEKQGSLTSGENLGYLVTGERFVSMWENPKTMYYNHTDFSKSYIKKPNQRDFITNVIDVYFTSNINLNSPEYFTSFYQSRSFFNNALEKTYAPVLTDGNIFYNVPVGFKLLQSYIGKDFVKLNNIYSLNTINGDVSLNYYLLSQVTNFSDVFVLNKQPFIIRNNIIYACVIVNQQIVNIEPVVSIGAMKFVGNTNNTAFFYSEQTRSIYSFTGSTELDLATSGSAITDIYYTYKNIEDDSIFVATNIGVIVISDSNTYILDFYGIKKIETDNKHFYLFQENKIIQLSKEKNGQNEKQKVHIETIYFGDVNSVNVVDCFYIRFYCDDECREGEVRLNVKTITDIGVQAETKVYKIAPNMWDVNNSYYLRYQPKLQRGVGTSLELISDFAISSLSVGVSPQGHPALSRGNV